MVIMKRSIGGLLFWVLSFCFLLLLTKTMDAVPARIYPIEYRLPDGKTLTIQMYGDEYFYWVTTIDEYTLLLNKNGFYEYAVKNQDDNLVLSGVVAHDAAQRLPEEIAFVQTLSPFLTFSEAQLSVGKQMRKINNDRIKQSKFPALGTIKIPVLLIQFQDVHFTYTKEDFELLMNQPDYNQFGATGSVRDYFLDNSFGKMRLQTDVFGVYEASKELAYYGRDDEKNTISPTAPRVDELIQEAVEAASPDVDFSEYDNDKNGEVEVFYVIYAGQDQSQTGHVDEMWARQGHLRKKIVKNGVSLSAFACSQELWYEEGGDNRLTGMGVIAHEFSHAFGLVDYYDTDNARNGNAHHLRYWDIMATGSYLNEGRTPPFHNAFSMEELGWLTITEINSAVDKIEMPKFVLGDSNTRRAYRINTFRGGLDNAEYFFFENKQRVKWDQYLPNTGLLVFHADKARMDAASFNCWNCNPENQALFIVPANNRFNMERGPNVVFPYQGNNAFTNQTQPNMLSNDGYPSYFILKNITHDTINGIVTFKVEEDDILLVDVCGKEPVNQLAESFDNLPVGEDIEDYNGWQSFDIENAGVQWQGAIKENNKYPEISTKNLPVNQSFDTWLVSPLIKNDETFNKEISFKQGYISSNTSNAFVKEMTASFLQCHNNKTYMQIMPVSFPKRVVSDAFWSISSKTLSVFGGDFSVVFRFKGVKTDDITLKIDSVSIRQVSTAINYPEEKMGPSITLMPNPVSDHFLVQSQTPVHEFEIYDLTGCLIMRKKTMSNAFQVDVTNLPSGLYMLKCVSRNTVETQRFVKR